MRFDFTGRFMAAFGIIAANTAKPAEIQEVEKDDLSGLRSYVWSREHTFDDVRLYRDSAGGKEDYLFGFRSIMDETPEIFATAPMLSLKRSKKLVITAIDNSDIEVVERYATSPYEISWRGLLIDLENHEFPLSKMERMNKIFEVNEVWNVAGEILQAVGVNALFIKDITFDFVEGYEDTVAYIMTAQAVRPLEYQLMEL